MKRVSVFIWFFLFLVFAGMSCIFEDTLEKILKDFSNATEKLIQDIKNSDKANDSKAIARGLKNYGNTVGKIVERLQALKDKHKDQQQEIKLDLDKMRKDFEDVLKQFTGLVVQLAKYLMDSDVMEALKEVQQELSGILK